MSLTQAQLEQRDGKLTASRVGVLMGGDPEKIIALWEVMTGQRDEDDLSDVWAVQLGVITETLNLDWYERRTGRRLTDRGTVITRRTADWAACTLDGYDTVMAGPVDAKHVGGFEKIETVVQRYTAQMHWQMLCCGCQWSALSIIEGAREPVIVPVPINPAYATELWSRAEAFMQCVWNLAPPLTLPGVEAPIPPEQWRTVSMDGNNEWTSCAVDWIAHKPAAKKFETAAKSLKALIANDVGLATGAGIKIKRAKTGALTISEEK